MPNASAAWGSELKPDQNPAKGTVPRMNVWHIRGPGQRVSDNARFLYDIQTSFYNSVKDFVTKELGFDHILFNGSGWFGNGWLDTLDIAANLVGMDFYDQHGYGLIRSTILRPGNEQTIRRQSIGQLQIRAPKLQGLVGEADGTQTDLGAVAMNLKDTGTLSVCIASMDNLPLDRSQRMMLCAVGEVKPLNRREVVFETFDAATAPADWAAGEFEGKSGVSYRFVGAKKASIGAGSAIGLKPNGEGQLSAKLPDGAREFKFQYKPLASGEVELEVLVAGQVRVTTKKENIEAQQVDQDFRLNNLVVPDIRDASVEDLPRKNAQPGAEILIRTTGQCVVPVAIDNLEIAPLDDPRLGDQLVMRPPVGDIVFAQPVKAVYGLDLSGRRKAEATPQDGGKRFRLDNTHRTPWFEVVR